MTLQLAAHMPSCSASTALAAINDAAQAHLLNALNLRAGTAAAVGALAQMAIDSGDDHATALERIELLLRHEAEALTMLAITVAQMRPITA